MLVTAASRDLKRRLGPMAWAVLEDVALDASADDVGRLVATTSSRRVADNLGLTPGTAARALGRLRALGLVSYTRYDGAAGRFGLSGYVLGPIAGLDVVADGPQTQPHPLPPRSAPPSVATPCNDRPRAVVAHMVESEAAADEALHVAESALQDFVSPAPAPESRRPGSATRSGGGGSSARRGRQMRGVTQLSIFDATHEAHSDNTPEDDQ